MEIGEFENENQQQYHDWYIPVRFREYKSLHIVSVLAIARGFISIDATGSVDQRTSTDWSLPRQSNSTAVRGVNLINHLHQKDSLYSAWYI